MTGSHFSRGVILAGESFQPVTAGSRVDPESQVGVL